MANASPSKTSKQYKFKDIDFHAIALSSLSTANVHGLTRDFNLARPRGDSLSNVIHGPVLHTTEAISEDFMPLRPEEAESVFDDFDVFVHSSRDFVSIEFRYGHVSDDHSTALLDWLQKQALIMSHVLSRVFEDAQTYVGKTVVQPGKESIKRISGLSDDPSPVYHGYIPIALRSPRILQRLQRATLDLLLESFADAIKAFDPVEINMFSDLPDLQSTEPEEIRTSADLLAADWEARPGIRLCVIGPSQLFNLVPDPWMTWSSFYSEANRAAAAAASHQPLKPGLKVLKDLRWDPRWDLEKYLVVYNDRFLGRSALPAPKWERDTTADKFIPEHKMLAIMDADTGKVMWDRHLRIDWFYETGRGSVPLRLFPE